MRARASTISAGPRRAAPANGATASASSSRPTLAPAVRELLAPYLDAVASFNRGGDLAGLSGLARARRARWLRTQDRLIACEREPDAARALAARMRGDKRVKAIAIDGYTALNAYVPPPERRGLVLIDPPFEQADEFDQLAQALAGAHRKWPTGIYMLWYPVKDARETAAFARRLARARDPAHPAGRARACGARR